ncbi:MAG: hypothetical protein Q9163_003352 [Psora crenata]
MFTVGRETGALVTLAGLFKSGNKCANNKNPKPQKFDVHKNYGRTLAPGYYWKKSLGIHQDVPRIISTVLMRARTGAIGLKGPQATQGQPTASSTGGE